MLAVRALHCLGILVMTLGAVPQSAILELRAHTALKQGRYVEALAAFEALVDQQPGNPLYHYGKGVALSRLLDHGAAAEALERVVALDSQNAPAYRQLVTVYSQLARTESTLSAFRKACSLESVPEAMRLPLAQALRKRDLFEEAVSLLNGSASPEANLELGLIEMERENYRRAVGHLQIATSDPIKSTATAEFEYGRCLELLDDSEQAIEHYRRALEKDRNLGKARFRLGNLLIRLGDREMGLALLHDYEEFRRWDRRVKLLVAMIGSSGLPAAKLDKMTLELIDLLHQAGSFDEAERVIESGLARNPDDPLLRVAWARTLNEQGKTEAARRELESVLSLPSPPPSAFWISGLVHYRAGQKPEALEACLRFLELVPDPPVLFFKQLGTLYAMSGQFAEAETYFKRAVVKDPKDPRLHMNLASTLEQLGKAEEAEAEREMARRLEANP